MKLAVRSIRNDAVACVDEVLIPLNSGEAVLTAQALRHLSDFRKRAFTRLGEKDRRGSGETSSVTAVEYRVEGNTLVVHVLRGMLG